MNKLFDRQTLAPILNERRFAGERIVFTNGCFDLIHAGHVRYLRQARALGDCLVIGLNSDASVRRLKGPARPLMSEQDRAEVLSALECVTFITLFSEDTPVETISVLRPDIHVKGGDYDVEALPETPVVRSYGGEVVILPFVEGRSTSDLIRRLNESGS